MELNFEKTIIKSSSLRHMCAELPNGYGSSQGPNPRIFQIPRSNIWHRKTGASLTSEEYSAAKRQVSQHNTWFKKHVVDEDTIMIIPRYSLEYRDEYLP